MGVKTIRFGEVFCVALFSMKCTSKLVKKVSEDVNLFIGRIVIVLCSAMIRKTQESSLQYSMILHLGVSKIKDLD